ncbi:MAG: hypothetical protein QW568_04110 [Candidatus Anstonellaceae archaeon]
MLISSKSQRAQAIPLDLMMGVFVFVVMAAYFFILWDIFSLRFVEHAQTIDDELVAISVADRLVGFGGYPSNWTQAPLTAQSVGFASKQNEIEWSKVAAFAGMPYASQKIALGADKDFLIKIEQTDGARLVTIGQETTNATRVAEVTRLAMMNGSIVNVRVQVYET